MRKIQLSVVVCTYNRAGLLEHALESLVRQTLAKDLYEIVVVDNNSTDNTFEVAEAFCRRYSNLRYYFEPRQGLSHARNLGYQVVQGEYVAYIDDDCSVPEHWLAVAEEVIRRVSPAVFGGPYFAYYTTPKPAWFQDRYGSHFHGDEARPLKEGEYLDGANIFFRRVLLHDLGGFSPDLGMSGGRLGYGEETALQRRIRATKPEELLYYEPKLLVYHLVPSSKMTLRWIIRAAFVGGRYYHLVFFGDKPLTMTLGHWLKQTVRTLWALCADIARGTVTRDRRRYPFLQNYLYEYAFVNLRQLGELYGQFLQMYGMRRWHVKGR